VLVPPPRFGEGVRGWGLRDAAPRPHPPDPPLRSGEGEKDKTSKRCTADPTP